MQPLGQALQKRTGTPARRAATVARVSFRSDCTRLQGPVRPRFLACERKLELTADVRDDSIDLVLGGARNAAVHDSRVLAALHSERHVRMLAKRIR